MNVLVNVLERDRERERERKEAEKDIMTSSVITSGKNKGGEYRICREIAGSKDSLRTVNPASAI